MSAIKLFFLIFACAVGLRSTAAAQVVVSPRPGDIPYKNGEPRRENLDSDFNRGRRAMEAQARGSRATYAARRAPRVKPLTKAERAKIEAILAPDAEDTAKYKEFLKQNNTGLFRLFPDLSCESKNTVSAAGDCASLIPGSWSYSFRREDYSDYIFPDVYFKDGNLVSRGLLSQGILMRLGDVPLETVSPAAGGVKSLLEFAPATQIEEAKKQFVQISKGIDAGDGYRYGNSLRAEENTTYVLRAIAYRTEVKMRSLTPGAVYVMPPLAFRLIKLNEIDKREDLTIALRIVRQDKNGSITVLWKELARKQSPKIVYGKTDLLTDFK